MHITHTTRKVRKKLFALKLYILSVSEINIELVVPKWLSTSQAHDMFVDSEK